MALDMGTLRPLAPGGKWGRSGLMVPSQGLSVSGQCPGRRRLRRQAEKSPGKRKCNPREVLGGSSSLANFLCRSHPMSPTGRHWPSLGLTRRQEEEKKWNVCFGTREQMGKLRGMQKKRRGPARGFATNNNTNGNMEAQGTSQVLLVLVLAVFETDRPGRSYDEPQTWACRIPKNTKLVDLSQLPH